MLTVQYITTCSCAIGEVVDNNLKLINKDNVFIGDISVLDKPCGSTASHH